MESKELIIALIQQDMKHYQLVTGLEKLGLESGGMHYLSLMEIICRLMHVPEGPTDDRWSWVYIGFMNEAALHPVTSTGKGLRPLAELCYAQLQGVLEFERVVS